jgi:hypothetical protein
MNQRAQELHLEPKRLREPGPFRELCAQALDVTLAQRDRPAPRGAAGRVREADEALALRRLEQLHERREPPLARLLTDRQLLDELSGAHGVAVLPMEQAYGERRHTNVTPLAQLVSLEAPDAGIDVDIVDLPTAAGPEGRDLDPR